MGYTFNGDERKLAQDTEVKLLAKLTEVFLEEGPPKKAKKDKTSPSIKSEVIGLILQDKEDAEIVETIKSGFPASKFNFAHISWYRSTLFRDGMIEAKHAPRRNHAYKAWKKMQEV